MSSRDKTSRQRYMTAKGCPYFRWQSAKEHKITCDMPGVGSVSLNWDNDAQRRDWLHNVCQKTRECANCPIYQMNEKREQD